MTKRSPVSKFLGSSCRRKESTLPPFTDGFEFAFSGGQNGIGEGLVLLNGGWLAGCSGTFCDP